ncbi:hypothetical protein GGI16_004824, partial [Coemansia sp. S142-1]
IQTKRMPAYQAGAISYGPAVQCQSGHVIYPSHRSAGIGGYTNYYIASGIGGHSAHYMEMGMGKPCFRHPKKCTSAN